MLVEDQARLDATEGDLAKRGVGACFVVFDLIYLEFPCLL
jgi:hypothetical protein